MKKIIKVVLWLTFGLTLLLIQTKVYAENNDSKRNVIQENNYKTFDETLKHRKEKSKRIEKMKDEIERVYNEDEYENLKQKLVNSDYEDKDDYIEATNMLIKKETKVKTVKVYIVTLMIILTGLFIVFK